jgi:DNA-binding NtrC family response regulator
MTFSMKVGPRSREYTAMLNNDWPTLDVLRLRYIAQVLERNTGNKTRAAEMLGIDRRTLNRILARERAKKAAAARNYRPAASVTSPSVTSPSPAQG